MTTAIIIAGGLGQRMGQDIPKQFINVYDKPVIIYTLEGFQKHPMIDSILVVCLDGWHDVLRAGAAPGRSPFETGFMRWKMTVPMTILLSSMTASAPLSTPRC